MDQSSPSGKIYTLQFVLLCLSNALFSASFNMLIPELPAYLSSMGGEDYKGYIIGLFTLMAGLSRPFSGKLTDSIGRIPVMIFGSVVCVICSLLYPLISSVGAFLLLRFFHGFSTGFKPTGTSAYVSDLVPHNRRAEAMGMVGLFSTIGLAMGPAIGGFIAAHWGINIMFQVSGVFALLSVVILIGMKETLHDRQRFNPSLLKINRNEIFEPLVLAPVIITFLTYVSYGALLTIIPDFSNHLGVKNKGLFFTFFTISSIGVRLVAGKMSDRYGRVPMLKISATLMAVSMFMMAVTTSPAMLMASAVVYGISLGINSPAVTAWTIDLGLPTHRGRALASMYIALEAGIGLGAYMSAYIYNNNAAFFPLTFGILGTITIMATVYLLLIYNNQRLKVRWRFIHMKAAHIRRGRH
ncbi:MFS transporter [Chitinophaga pendula]|uniref:MFS transporter n=1 Tax=Chitinophaga TaxID=79328 RepID=UPI000BAF04F9|nr:MULTISPECIES: MFS transporter [Chitinophaga]ASZ10410.1 MFS transporter [Chitinophaga sp. MD30]UCJ06623.1 MFS transporter [Chitinophaga pendula]